MEILVKKTDDRAILPFYATDGSAGMDISVVLDTPYELKPQERRVFGTGIAVSIPPEHVGLVFQRSSMGFKFGISMPNSVGVIDSDYRGEICVALINLSSKPVIIEPNQRVAQLVVVHTPQLEIIEVDELDKTARGSGGFGSTGL